MIRLQVLPRQRFRGRGFFIHLNFNFMERKIGENFTFEGIDLLVLENCNLSSTFYRKGFAVCTTDCFFCLDGACYCDLKVAGDCQRAQRSDRRNVYFVDAALARSPLGSEAAI